MKKSEKKKEAEAIFLNKYPIITKKEAGFKRSIQQPFKSASFLIADKMNYVK
jgi:hypothetical protein